MGTDRKPQKQVILNHIKDNRYLRIGNQGLPVVAFSLGHLALSYWTSHIKTAAGIQRNR
jgi:hypothetical protein